MLTAITKFSPRMSFVQASLKSFPSHSFGGKVPCYNVLIDSITENLKPQFSKSLYIK